MLERITPRPSGQRQPISALQRAGTIAALKATHQRLQQQQPDTDISGMMDMIDWFEALLVQQGVTPEEERDIQTYKRSLRGDGN
jgi:hypothetical protein